MKGPVRFAIVGLGMGRKRAEACAGTPNAALTAVCDTDAARGREAASTLGVEWVSDFDALIRRDDVDVIGLWTPSGTHADLAVRAIAAGKHVCMTKPMDIRTEACDRAIASAEKAGRTLAIDFDCRYEPVYHRIADALRQGALGDILLVDLRMKWYRSQDYYDAGDGWRSRTLNEGGSLSNQAVHFLDLLLWWFGPAKRVIGQSGTFGHKIDTEDATLAIVEFASGARASILVTTCNYPQMGTSIEITGRKGSLIIKDGEIQLFRVLPDTTEAASASSGYQAQFAEREGVDLAIDGFSSPLTLPRNIFADVSAHLLTGTSLQCDAFEARRSVELFESIYTSSREGQWVTIPARKQK